MHDDGDDGDDDGTKILTETIMQYYRRSGTLLLSFCLFFSSEISLFSAEICLPFLYFLSAFCRARFLP